MLYTVINVYNLHKLNNSAAFPCILNVSLQMSVVSLFCRSPSNAMREVTIILLLSIVRAQIYRSGDL